MTVQQWEAYEPGPEHGSHKPTVPVELADVPVFDDILLTYQVYLRGRGSRTLSVEEQRMQLTKTGELRQRLQDLMKARSKGGEVVPLHLSISVNDLILLENALTIFVLAVEAVHSGPEMEPFREVVLDVRDRFTQLRERELQQRKALLN